MKKSIVKRLIIIILASMLFSLLLNYYLQVRIACRDVLESSQELFWQIRQVLEDNEAETEQTKADFAENCLVRAKAAAYLVQYHPDMLKDQAEMEKVARLLQVDEFHIFDKEGNLYAGSEPQYFGLNFNSGEQMQFFLPMLEDKSLELCQEITPNTAEQKMMQYAAVWREDGEEIVQIGMEPDRVLEVMEKTELSYIFALVTVDPGVDVYAIDSGTHKVLGAMNPEHQGRKAEDIGIFVDRVTDENKLYTMTVDNEVKSCAFEERDGVILVRASDRQALFDGINRNTLLIGLYLLVLSLVIIFFITRYLDKYIIQSIYQINEDMMRIAGGTLDIALPEQPTPELSELSSHVNEMVKSILDTTNKLSLVLQRARVPMAVYEYNPGMERVMVTSRMKEILNLENDEAMFYDYRLFKKRMDEIRKNPVDAENAIFRIPGNEERYVRIDSFEYEKSILGIVTDMTPDILEKRCIEMERDIDLLTNLFSRRAFYNLIEELFSLDTELGDAAVMMIDSDNLKMVNDVYGHENGDLYLRAIGEILNGCRAEHKLASRLSGDEFALFIYGCSGRAELETYIGEILDAGKHRTVIVNKDIHIPVQFSAGWAFYPEEGRDIHHLLGIADERMYQNKRRHKMGKVRTESSMDAEEFL